MDRQLVQAIRDRTPRVNLGHLDPARRQALPRTFAEFVDAAATATARATYYNTREEQEDAALRVHQELCGIDRGIYAASLLLPGLNDYARQMGVLHLLSGPPAGSALMTPGREEELLRRLLREIPPQRVLKLFGWLRDRRVNNARTRKLILQTLLADPGLEHRAVRYRRKLARALRHAWGERTAGILKSILLKDPPVRSLTEQRIVRRNIGRFAGGEDQRAVAEECVRFVLGIEDGLSLPRLQAYREAKRDLSRGRLLPYEVLEGIRSRFHRDRRSDEVLDLTRKQLTTGQQMALQREARDAQVEVRFDPARYDPVRLYLYAFEMGLTEEIRRELEQKALRTAGRMPARFGSLGVLLDGSASMVGDETQRRRPIAVALALRDLLCAMADDAAVVASDGRPAPACELLEPRGDTSMAAGLVALLSRGPEAVFIISDGYENAPAGRTDEVIHAARRMGIATPIYQLSPVFSAESRAVRALSMQAPAMPASRPEALGLGLLKAAMEVDLERGVGALLGLAARALEAPRDGRLILKGGDDVREEEERDDHDC